MFYVFIHLAHNYPMKQILLVAYLVDEVTEA